MDEMIKAVIGASCIIGFIMYVLFLSLKLIAYCEKTYHTGVEFFIGIMFIAVLVIELTLSSICRFL